MSGRTPQSPFDDETLCALLLHPDVTEAEALRRAAARRRLRLGLTVAAMSGMTLVPAVSLADDTGVPAPIVTETCEITDVLDDGTPSGLLEDGSVCVKPVEEPAPEPTPEPDPGAGPPAQQPPPAPEPEADPPPVVAPASAPEAADPEPAPERAPAAAEAVAESPAPVVPQPAAGVPASQKTPALASTPASRPAATRQQPASARPERRKARTKHRRAARTRQAPASVPALLPGLLPGGTLPAAFFVTDEPVIPQFLIKLYKQAGREYKIPWPILAAINEIETDFGRNVAVSSAGATGWMQFMPATWRAYGVDADKNGVKDPDNPHDAIFAAARYLKASGAKHNMRRAIFAYNHAGWYVDSILLRAERIAAHQGERNQRLEKLFDAGARRLERQVLSDPRITLYECGRQDIEEHKIDRRVLIALRFLAWSGLHPTVTSLQCGHSVLTASGNISEHASGSAVDIVAINNIPIFGNQGPGSVTESVIRELLTLRGAMAPHQIISLMSFEGVANAMAMADHADHIHVGFEPLAPLKQISPRKRLLSPLELLSPFSR